METMTKAQRAKILKYARTCVAHGYHTEATRLFAKLGISYVQGSMHYRSEGN